MVDVTQADRVAAANAVSSARPILADEIVAGRMDNYAGVQAFAAHRLAAEARAERLVEAVELLLTAIDMQADLALFEADVKAALSEYAGEGR